MTKTTKTAAASALVAMLAGSTAGGYALATSQRPPAARYQLRSDLVGMPGTIVLRNCGPTEDSYAKPLKVRDFEGPTSGSRLVLRCATP